MVRVSRRISAKSSFAEPLAVEADLELLGRGVDDQRRLLEIGLGVPVDLFVREQRPLRRAAGRIADSSRVVADDEDTLVALGLEGRHPLKRDRVADVHVGRGDVDAELHPQGASLLEFPLELACRQDVHRVPSQLRNTHRSGL